MPKPDARAALGRLITADDLPGDEWTIVDQRTWRTGMTGPPTPWARRARAARSVTAYRSFAAGSGQGCWVQVIAFASEADALSALEEVSGRLLRKQSKSTVVREQDVTVDPFQGAGRVWAHEFVASTPDGEATTKIVAAAVSSQVAAVCASGSPGWDWDVVVTIARRQAAELLAVA